MIDDLTHRMICGRKVEFTEAERQQILAERLEFQAQQQAREATRLADEQRKTALKQGIMSKLGISEDEMNLLLGKK